jgi:hypothetical protein
LVNSKYKNNKGIKGAFAWDNTPEGFDYWDKINKEMIGYKNPK